MKTPKFFFRVRQAERAFTTAIGAFSAGRGATTPRHRYALGGQKGADMRGDCARKSLGVGVAGEVTAGNSDDSFGRRARVFRKSADDLSWSYMIVLTLNENDGKVRDGTVAVCVEGKRRRRECLG
jgi:hypothetical protein